MPPDRAPRKAPAQWTPEEEAVWIEMVVACLNQHLLPMVRADGRLEARSSGLKAHLKALINQKFGRK